MLDLGILWVGPLAKTANGPEHLYTYRCDCEGNPHGQHVGKLTLMKINDAMTWLPTGVTPEKDRTGVWSSAGRFWVERTRAEGVTMRWGMIPVTLTDMPRAHVTVQYTVTVKTGDTEDIAGGAVFMKANVGVTMPCAPDEVKDVEADLAEWLGGVLEGERNAIIEAYGIEPQVSLDPAPVAAA